VRFSKAVTAFIGITARCLSGAALATVAVPTQFTVAELKAEIIHTATLEAGVYLQQLIFDGGCLKDATSLEDAGLTDGSDGVPACVDVPVCAYYSDYGGSDCGSYWDDYGHVCTDEEIDEFPNHLNHWYDSWFKEMVDQEFMRMKRLAEPSDMEEMSNRSKFMRLTRMLKREKDVKVKAVQTKNKRRQGTVDQRRMVATQQSSTNCTRSGRPRRRKLQQQLKDIVF